MAEETAHGSQDWTVTSAVTSVSVTLALHFFTLSGGGPVLKTLGQPHGRPVGEKPRLLADSQWRTEDSTAQPWGGASSEAGPLGAGKGSDDTVLADGFTGTP